MSESKELVMLKLLVRISDPLCIRICRKYFKINYKKLE